MLATSPEQHRHGTRDDRAEANTPRECHHRQPIRLRVQLTAEQAGDTVWKIAQNRDDHETHNHPNNVSKIVAAPFGEHAAEENAEERTVRVSEDPEHDWN